LRLKEPERRQQSAKKANESRNLTYIAHARDLSQRKKTSTDREGIRAVIGYNHGPHEDHIESDLPVFSGLFGTGTGLIADCFDAGVGSMMRADS
jgi:hypothetical protein